MTPRRRRCLQLIYGTLFVLGLFGALLMAPTLWAVLALGVFALGAWGYERVTYPERTRS